MKRATENAEKAYVEYRREVLKERAAFVVGEALAARDAAYESAIAKELTELEEKGLASSAQLIEELVDWVMDSVPINRPKPVDPPACVQEGTYAWDD